MGATGLPDTRGADIKCAAPFKIAGDVVLTIQERESRWDHHNCDLLDVGDGHGCAGRYVNVGTTTLSVAAGSGSAAGTLTAANGDESLLERDRFDILGLTLTVTAYDGTGPFGAHCRRIRGRDQ